MKTYKKIIEGKELVVTDTLIMAKEFGLRHDNLLKKARKVASEILRDDNRCPECSGELMNNNSSRPESSGGLFIESSYKDGNNQSRPKVILTEQAFYYIIMEINHAKGKEQRELLSKIKRDFTDEFFQLRQDNKDLIEMGKFFIEYLAPFDGIGHISVFNGKEKGFLHRACLTSVKNDRPMTREMYDKLLEMYQHPDLIETTIRELNRYEENKKKTQGLKYVPCELYFILNAKDNESLKPMRHTPSLFNI